MSNTSNLIKSQERKKKFLDTPTTSEMLLTEEYLNNVMTEAAKKSIPDSLQKKLSSNETRQGMKEKYGDKAFLLPEELKFPVVDPDSGEYNCKLIYAAWIRAQQHDYTEVEKEAKDLYRKQGCDEKIEIEIKDHDEKYDVTELYDIISG